ncbi:MAG TPA: sigma-70 family RNA polymerase sigma factor [Chloroflexi bacterium]|nr:sigma-70 family RNA polymerase sigma factor [Chloroflexota bacterium]
MDERKLVERARKGDLDAFNELVIRYQKTAYNVAYRILGDAEAAADAVQDAFLKAFKNIRRFRGGSFKSWMFRIVTNTCYDVLRARKRRPSSSLDGMEVELNHTPLGDSGVESPEEYAIRQELNRLIQEAINSLPPEQRVIIVLSDIEGFDYREISETLGIPLGTVKSRLSRARAKVRDLLLAQEELLPVRYRLKVGADSNLESASKA